MLYGYLKCRRRLKRRNLFNVNPLESCAETARVRAWTDDINLLNYAKEVKMGIEPSETLPAGHKLQWTHWKSLNRLRTGYGRAAALMHNWGYSDNLRCTCGELQTMQHLLECVQLDQKCIVEYIHAANNVALETALYWAKNIQHDRRDTIIYCKPYSNHSHAFLPLQSNQT